MATDCVYLITVEKVRDITGLSAQAEDRRLLPHIQRAQTELSKAMGLTGYRELIALIQVDPDLSTDADWETLHCDYLQPWLAWKSYEFALPFFQADVARNGVTTFGESQGISKATKSDVHGMASACEAAANNIMEAMILFLDENRTTYDWWGTTIDEDRPTGMRAAGIRLTSYKGCGFNCKCKECSS